MRRFFVTSLAVVFILLSPALFSSHGVRPGTIAPALSGVAFAGHTVNGGWCRCGCTFCLCDEGEESQLCMQATTPSSEAEMGNATVGSSTSSESEFDYGTALLMLVLASFMIVRLAR